MKRPKPSIPPANLALAAQGGETEGKPVQEPLAHSLSYVQTIFEKSPVGMMTCKATGEIVSTNPALARLSGGTKEQIEKQNFRNLKVWQDSGLLSAVEDVLASGVEWPFEGHAFTYFGKEVWVSGLLTPFSYEGERYLLVMLTDTTRSKLAEDALRESEERFRRLTQVTFEGIVIHDGGKVLDANPAAIAMFGYEHSEVIGEEILKFVAPESQEMIIKRLQAQVDSPIEAFGQRKDGTIFPLEILGRTFRHSGSTLRVTALRDITERKRAEERLAESLERLDLATSAAHLGIWDWDIKKNELVWDDRMYELYGIKRGDFSGAYEAWLAGIHPDDREQSDEISKQARFGTKGYDTEFRVVWPDGTIHVLKAYGQVIRDTDGNAIRMIGVNYDITERKRVEGELSMAETKYRNLVEQMPAATYIDAINETSSTIYFSPQIEVMTGYSPDEWESDPELWVKLLHPADRERVLAENARTNKAGESFRIEYRLFSRDGRTVWVLDEAKMLRDNAGQPLFWQGILLDITERKQAEVDLQHKLKELTVLHEVAIATTQSASVDELIEHITQTINVSLYPDNCGVLLFDEAANVLRPHPSYRGVTEAKSWISIPLGQGVTGRVAASRQPARIGNVNNVPYFINVNAEMQSELYVPVITGERLLGVINAESAKLDAFTVSDENLLITIAGTLATAIEKLHLFEETSRRLEHVQALHRIDTAISNSQDLGLTINIFLEEVMQQLGVHATDILMLQPYTLTLEYLSGRGFKTKALQHTQLRLGQGYAGLAGQERKTIHISNLRVHKTDFLRSPDFNFEEFESYYGVLLIAKGQLKGVLEVFQRGPLEGDREWLDFLEILAGQAAIAIDNVTMFNDLQRTNSDLRMAYDATIEGWSRALDLRDEVTEGHTQRVVELTMKLAQEMGITETEQVHVLRGTLLHDIGKLGVPDNILRKTGPLTADEWGIMRKHPLLAYEMLIPISYLRQALDIPFCHHEKWDGNGYPRGLKGEQIPLAARIFSVVDVWDALISDRPYRKAWTREEALAYIRDQAGKHFDPQVVDIFLREVDTVKG